MLFAEELSKNPSLLSIEFQITKTTEFSINNPLQDSNSFKGMAERFRSILRIVVPGEQVKTSRAMTV